MDQTLLMLARDRHASLLQEADRTRIRGVRRPRRFSIGRLPGRRMNRPTE